MKTIRLVLLCVGVGAAVAACAVATTKQNPAESRTVVSGSRDKVAYFYNLTDQCQVAGVPQITVTKAPSNGTVTIGAGNDVPQYPADNPRSVCNQAAVSSAEVFYQSSPNFHGADDFAISVKFSSSFTQTYSYNVTVN